MDDGSLWYDERLDTITGSVSIWNSVADGSSNDPRFERWLNGDGS